MCCRCGGKRHWAESGGPGPTRLTEAELLGRGSVGRLYLRLEATWVRWRGQEGRKRRGGGGCCQRLCQHNTSQRHFPCSPAPPARVEVGPGGCGVGAGGRGAMAPELTKAQPAAQPEHGAGERRQPARANFGLFVVVLVGSPFARRLLIPCAPNQQSCGRIRARHDWCRHRAD